MAAKKPTAKDSNTWVGKVEEYSRKIWLAGLGVYSKIDTDGIYGPATAESVRVFQSVFGLPQTGVVDYRTWYKISEIYVGVSRIAELV